MKGRTFESVTETWDAKRALPELYTGKAEWRRVTVPPRQVLAVDGHGDPNTSAEYADAVAALYGLAYNVRFALKKAGAIEFAVPPLEGLWWADDMSAYSATPDKASWNWTMLIPLPDVVDEPRVAEVKPVATKKHPEIDYDRVELRCFDEGDSIQYLWVGPYDREHEVLQPLHQGGLTEMGLTYNGLHHEVYLSDPRRTEPAKLKTLLRQPVRPL